MRSDRSAARPLNVLVDATRRTVLRTAGARAMTPNTAVLPDGPYQTPWLLLVRLWLWAVLLRPLKHVLPIVALVRLVHARPARGGQSGLAGRLDVLFRYARRFPHRAPSNCLERSLGAYRLLCRAGAQPELVIGMKRTSGGRIEGHTWVVVDARPLAEDTGALAGFAPLLAFDAHGRQAIGPARLPRGMRVA
jgi:transglutaminase superfamily protein